MRATAYGQIRKALAEINEQWRPGTVYDGERFGLFDEFLVRAIEDENLTRVVEVCDRYKASVMRDIQEVQKGKPDGRMGEDKRETV